MKSYWLVYALLLTFLISCMPKIVNEEEVADLTASAVIEVNGQQANIVITGTCPPNTTSIRVSIDLQEFQNV